MKQLSTAFLLPFLGATKHRLGFSPKYLHYRSSFLPIVDVRNSITTTLLLINYHIHIRHTLNNRRKVDFTVHLLLFNGWLSGWPPPWTDYIPLSRRCHLSKFLEMWQERLGQPDDFQKKISRSGKMMAYWKLCSNIYHGYKKYFINSSGTWCSG